MTITEARRQHLYELTRERLDEEAAETLMEYIASVNSAELATKSDVHTLKSDVNGLKSDVNGLQSDVHVLRSDVHALRSELYEMQSRYITWLLASQGVLIAAIAAATSVIIAVLM
jgi:polyhydroxyalkanoate synthesis regulator phasin